MSLMVVLSKTIHMICTVIMKFSVHALTSFTLAEIGGKKTWRVVACMLKTWRLFTLRLEIMKTCRKL